MRFLLDLFLGSIAITISFTIIFKYFWHCFHFNFIYFVELKNFLASIVIKITWVISYS